SLRAISAAWSPQVSWTRVRVPAVSSGGLVRGLAKGFTGGLEGLLEVGDEVVDMFDARRNAQQTRAHTGGRQAGLVELGMRGGCRVRDAGLGVAQVDQPRR